MTCYGQIHLRPYFVCPISSKSMFLYTNYEFLQNMVAVALRAWDVIRRIWGQIFVRHKKTIAFIWLMIVITGRWTIFSNFVKVAVVNAMDFTLQCSPKMLARSRYIRLSHCGIPWPNFLWQDSYRPSRESMHCKIACLFWRVTCNLFYGLLIGRKCELD